MNHPQNRDALQMKCLEEETLIKKIERNFCVFFLFCLSCYERGKAAQKSAKRIKKQHAK
jgi:hypothetical protein